MPPSVLATFRESEQGPERASKTVGQKHTHTLAKDSYATIFSGGLPMYHTSV